MTLDIADEAFLREREEVERGIAKVLNSKGKPLVFTGGCRNCEEPVAAPLIFCDADCRDDHDHRQQRSKANLRV